MVGLVDFAVVPPIPALTPPAVPAVVLLVAILPALDPIFDLEICVLVVVWVDFEIWDDLGIDVEMEDPIWLLVVVVEPPIGPIWQFLEGTFEIKLAIFDPSVLPATATLPVPGRVSPIICFETGWRVIVGGFDDVVDVDVVGLVAVVVVDLVTVPTVAEIDFITALAAPIVAEMGLVVAIGPTGALTLRPAIPPSTCGCPPPFPSSPPSSSSFRIRLDPCCGAI